MPKASYYPHYIYDHIATYFEPGVYNNTLYQNGTEQAVHPQFNFSQPCDGFPSTKDVMVVMKTGATESFEKMPTQLLTGLQCVPDFLLFSDLVGNKSLFGCKAYANSFRNNKSANTTSTTCSRESRICSTATATSSAFTKRCRTAPFLK